MDPRLLVPILLLVVGGACRREDDISVGGGSSLKDIPSGVIAFVGTGGDDPLWPVLQASARRYADQAGTFQLRCVAPEASSSQAQIELLSALDEPSLVGLCIQVDDSEPLLPALRNLHSQGVHIVSMIHSLPGELRIGHVGLDEEGVGRAIAEATVRLVGEEGTIMLIHAGARHPRYGLRLSGFDRVLSRYTTIKILAEFDCQMDRKQARAFVLERSARYPRLSAWVSLDDWPLRGVSGEVEPLPAGVSLVTSGGTPDQWPLIRSGALPVVVAADYGELGLRAVQCCGRALQTKEPGRFEERYLAPIRTLRPDDLDAFQRSWDAWLETPAAGGGGLPASQQHGE